MTFFLSESVVLKKETAIMLSSRTAALQTKHAGLEKEIRREMARPSPDDDLVRDLKRQKLRVKDSIDSADDASA